MDAALTPEVLLNAYCQGIFPMADGRDAEDVFWVDPKLRGVLPLTGFHVSRSLAKRLRADKYRATLNVDFAGVVAGCADRKETWINDTIHTLYQQLHLAGFAHSLEVWEDDALVGGVYGVAIAGAFFGESMFSTRTDASKVALAYLTDHLMRSGFVLFDTQFITSHLASLGAIEISRDQYREQLKEALAIPAKLLGPSDLPRNGQELLQRRTQTS